MAEEEQVAEKKQAPPVVFHNLRRCAVKGRQMVGWCYRMCQPKGDLGLCGFPAAHAADSRTGVILRERRERELAEKAKRQAEQNAAEG